MVEELKYLRMIVQAKRNGFEGQKNEIIKKLILMTKTLSSKKLPSSNDGKNILERSVSTKRSIRSRSHIHERRRNDKLQKAENTAMRRILKTPKWAAQ